MCAICTHLSKVRTSYQYKTLHWRSVCRVRDRWWSKPCHLADKYAYDTKRFHRRSPSRSEWVELTSCHTKILIVRKGYNLFLSFWSPEMRWFNYLLVLIAGTIHLAYLIEAVVFSYIMPLSQCDIAMSASERGILGGAYFLGAICSSHLWGFLADTKGRRRIIILTLFVSFALDVCASLASNVYILATFRFLTGFL